MPLKALLAAALLCLAVGGCTQPSDTLVADTVSTCPAGPAPESLRVVSWNIRATLSSSLETIGDVLEDLDADVIALQEVDRDAERTGVVDQAGALAERLGMSRAFAASRKEGNGDFGVALLSRLPIATAERVALPAGASFEPRVALDTTLCAGGKRVRAVSVHADVYPWAGSDNATFLAGRVQPSVGTGVIVAGDLNQAPDDKAPRAFTGIGLVDTLAQVVASTAFGRRIDYVLLDDDLAPGVSTAAVEESEASDHKPVLVDVTLPPSSGG